MQFISLHQAKPGMKLAKDVYAVNGSVLLPAGTELDGMWLEELAQNGVHAFYVVFPNCPQPETGTEQEQMAFSVRQALDAAVFGEFFDIERVKTQSQALFAEFLDNPVCLSLLAKIWSRRDFLFVHSVHTCLLALLIGNDLGYDHTRLFILGLGALLHDVGKIVIPEALLHKPGPLSYEEYSEIKQHTSIGFNMLWQQPGIHIHVALMALQHHEQYSGGGYPGGLKAGQITEFSRIVSVANAYDSLTMPRTYRWPYLPHQAVELMLNSSVRVYDPRIVYTFARNIAIYPVGTTVELSTGEKAVVTKTRKNAATRPVVKVFRGTGKETAPGPEINLEQEKDISIVKVCVR